MDKLKAVFQECLGFPIPQSMLRGKKLVPLYEKPGECLLFGSLVAVQNSYLVQGYINNFIESGPEGYYVLGFWGHGVNSYAFYYSLVDKWRKLFFRLPYGGVYMDNKKAAKRIRIFLTKYIDFEKDIRNKVKHIIAVDSMWEGYYKISYKDGRCFELKESLLENPEFQNKLFCL